MNQLFEIITIIFGSLILILLVISMIGERWNDLKSLDARKQLIIRMCQLSSSWNDTTSRKYLVKIAYSAIKSETDQSYYNSFSTGTNMERLFKREVDDSFMDKPIFDDFKSNRNLYLVLRAIVEYDGGNSEQRALYEAVMGRMKLSDSTLEKFDKIYKNRVRARIYIFKNQSYQSSQSHQSDRDSNQSRTFSSAPSELSRAYSVLGLSPDCSMKMLESQKRTLLKKFHPDLYAVQGENAVRMATEKCKEINQAYETIALHKRKMN